MKALTKYLAMIAVLLTTYSFSNNERIDVGSRELTENEKKEIFAQENQEFLSSEKNDLSPTIYNNQYPPLIFNQTTHNLVGVSVLGDYLIIQDGSEWKIKPGYSKEAFSWKEQDPVMIIKNDSFFSSYFNGYKYKMVNARKNTAIEVKLQLGPILDNPYTLQIAAINPTTQEVILSDNSLWRLDPSQRKLLAKWIATDGIIIGTNVKSWFNNSYDYILINVNMLEEIKANRIE